MEQILSVRAEIYNQFDNSPAGPEFFFKFENQDAYAAYYTSMYLIQDTGEAVWAHMKKGFPEDDDMQAYLEFWGVMQAIEIQQDAIFELHKAITGCAPNIELRSAWKQIRETRNLCAGHPAKRSHNVPAPQRTFMSRSFGNYGCIRYELWDADTKNKTYPVINLRGMIDCYATEASASLRNILLAMKSRWPTRSA
jgi:hypothetical protein